MGWRRVTILPSAARTALVSYTAAEDIANVERIIVFIDVTALTAGASITPTLSASSPLPTAQAEGGDLYTLLVGAAITATGNTVLEVGPGVTAAANLVANRAVPPKWGFSMAVADTKSVTYSVSAWVYERD